MLGVITKFTESSIFSLSPTPPDWKIRHFRDELPIKRIDFRMCSEEAGDEVKEN
jgi:hypothetical protein